MVKRTLPLIVFLAVLIAAVSLPAQIAPKIYTGDRRTFRKDIRLGFLRYVPDQIIVRFEPAVQKSFDLTALSNGQTGRREVDDLGAKHGVMMLESQFPGAAPKTLDGREFDLTGFYRVTFGASIDAESVARDYAMLPGVRSAEPIGIHAVTVTPNDEFYPDQWHLNQANGSDIDVRKAWMIEMGNEDITVAILDTGVRYFHKDLGGASASYDTPTAADGNMWINQLEKNGSSGVDDDGNGYVDDWIGWDFVDGAILCWVGEDCDDPDNDPRDFNGHGTHCAGNVAAINNNGYATCSPAGGWGDGAPEPAGNGVKIMACRVGWSANFLFNEIGMVRMDLVAEALRYAADSGARIASCSFESSNSGGLGVAIDYFVAHGGLIFKAANNDGTQTADYMCGRSDVISVAATGPDDCVMPWSNYGTWVDISAPGEGIYSLYHDHEDPQNDYVLAADGTSVATPLAAGVAALVWSRHPGWTAAQVEQQLYDSADDIDVLPCNSSYANKLGAGRINAFNAVNTDGAATGIGDGPAGPRGGFRLDLDQNHPNPFNPSTKITFTLPKEMYARLLIFDVHGGLIATLVDGVLFGGFHEVLWNGQESRGNNVRSGVYFCRLEAGGQVASKKMIILK